MGHSEYDPATKKRRPSNAGRLLVAKRALTLVAMNGGEIGERVVTGHGVAAKRYRR